MSSTPVATVLIPTHNHGRLLTHSVNSALNQTVPDLEVFVVGDGVDEETRAAALSAAARDPRVRFFDFPKGPRHGEIHRHAALQEARGRIICYQSDDDLWLPGHVEQMLDLLRDADFAHALAMFIAAEQVISVCVGHLAEPATQERMRGRWNFIPLGNGAHTLELYRRLPFGWRTTPAGIWTDLYMWQQILAVDGVRAVSGRRPTVLHFPSPARVGWTLEQRERELIAWEARMQSPDFERELTLETLESALKARFRADVDLENERARSESAAAQIAEQQSRLAELEHGLADAHYALHSVPALNERCDQADRQITEFQQHVAAIESTLTWRLRNRLVRLPLVPGLVRRLASLVSARPDR